MDQIDRDEILATERIERRTQAEHLIGEHADAPDPECWMCDEEGEDQ